MELWKPIKMCIQLCISKIQNRTILTSVKLLYVYIYTYMYVVSLYDEALNGHQRYQNSNFIVGWHGVVFIVSYNGREK